MSNPERWALVLTAAGLSCVPDGLAPSETGPFQTGMPTITSLAWDCSVEDAAWIFEVETEAWTGGGRLWMTKDGSRLEEHRRRQDRGQRCGHLRRHRVRWLCRQECAVAPQEHYSQERR